LPTNLHLVLPGLLGPWRNVPEIAVPTPPALTRLLRFARCQKTAPTGLEATLFDLFAAAPADVLPIAAVTCLADGGEGDRGWWLRADPVNLQADLRQVLLSDARRLAIEPAEALALTAELNHTFGAEGVTFAALHPERWYVRLNADPGVRTHPLPTVVGRDINTLLPYGDGSGRWHSWLTEIQMLLHSHPVNQAREAAGRLPINSIWFWGEGTLPTTVRPRFDGVYTNEPLGQGLAQLAGVTPQSVPDAMAAWQPPATTDSLVILETARYDAADDDPARWAAHLAELEQHWFAPCLERLRGGDLTELSLYPCDGRVFVTAPKDLRRFWRRARSLPHYFSTP